MSSAINFKDDDRFDGLYLNVAQTTHGIEPLLDSVFSFLRRKTDFFAGPPGAADGAAAAVAKVDEVLQRHVRMYQDDQKKKQRQKEAASAPKRVGAGVKGPSKQPGGDVDKGKAGGDEEVIEMNTDGGFDVSGAAEAHGKPVITPLPSKTSSKPGAEISAGDDGGTTDPSPPETEPTPTATTAGEGGGKEGDGDNDGEDDGPAPVGNGGTVEGKYVWTQTLSEVVVTVPVPDHTRGRDLNVTISRTRLKVVLKTSSSPSSPSAQKQVLVDGDLVKPIICDDSFWTVEDGNRLVVNLQKQNQMEWWEAVCRGDPIINVRKINPESSSLSDLDGETRKTVEKMMFDQRQKALGLPTSDEQSKFDALENFKKQHPELDFTNAKMS